MMLTKGFSYITFKMLRNVTSFPGFFIFSIMNGCWMMAKVFYASIEMMMWFLSLSLFMCYIKFINLHMLWHLWIPGMKSSWLWCMIF
jgi:hypothetical protein